MCLPFFSRHQVVETDALVVVDIRNNSLSQELLHVQLRPSILETELLVAAVGLAKDEQLLGATNQHGMVDERSSRGALSGRAASLSEGVKNTLVSVATAYESSGGLWGTIGRLASKGGLLGGPRPSSSPSSSSHEPPPNEMKQLAVPQLEEEPVVDEASAAALREEECRTQPFAVTKTTVVAAAAAAAVPDESVTQPSKPKMYTNSADEYAHLFDDF